MGVSEQSPQQTEKGPKGKRRGLTSAPPFLVLILNSLLVEVICPPESTDPC